MDNTEHPTPKDLLAVLEERLREAKNLYEQGDNAGRAGVIAALATVYAFLISFKKFDEENLAVPLVALATALIDLDDGARPPMLQPAKIRGRPPDTTPRKGLRGYAAITMELLMKAGFTKQEAAREVARCLNNAKVPFGKSRAEGDWKAVASWRDQARGTATENFTSDVYHDLLQKGVDFRTTDRGALKRDLLKRLLAMLPYFHQRSEQK